MSVEPPIRCAVLVESGDLPGAKEASMPKWALLFANCDLAEAREKAAEWSRQNLGFRAVVMIYDDFALSGVSTVWAKP